METMSSAALRGFVRDLAFAEGKLEVQLTLGLINTVLWFWFMPWFARNFVRPYIDRSSFKKQWVSLHLQTYKNSGLEVNEEAAYELSTWSVPMIIQHGIGGMLCLPAMFNLFSPEVNAALACHGTLAELGFEWQDLITRFWQARYGTDDQKKMNNPSVLKLILAHHIVGSTMVLPMNMYFRYSRWYVEGNVLLQFASFVSLACQQYGFTHDKSTLEGARLMRSISIFTFGLILYTRVIRYAVVLFFLNREIYEAGYYYLFAQSLVVGCGLILFNTVMVKSSYKKMNKFQQNLAIVEKNHALQKDE